MAFVAAVTLAASGNSAASQAVRRDDVQKMTRLSGLPAASVVSIRQGLAVAIRNRGTRGADGVVSGVELHGEVIDPEAAQDLGFQSLRSRIDVDCANRRDRVVSMEVFDEPGLKGHPERRATPGGWVQPSPQAYLADVLRSVCGLRRAGDLQVASLDQDAPIPTALPKRAGPPQVQAQAPALRPAIDPTPPPPPPEAEAPAAKPAAQPATKAQSGAGQITAQVGAVTSEAAAQRALKAVARHIPRGAKPRVEPARVDGQAIYRALVGGFDTRDAARGFCRAVTAGGGGCFVR